MCYILGTTTQASIEEENKDGASLSFDGDQDEERKKESVQQEANEEPKSQGMCANFEHSHSDSSKEMLAYISVVLMSLCALNARCDNVYPWLLNA